MEGFTTSEKSRSNFSLGKENYPTLQCGYGLASNRKHAVPPFGSWSPLGVAFGIADPLNRAPRKTPMREAIWALLAAPICHVLSGS
jgi:hypothetical protein